MRLVFVKQGIAAAYELQTYTDELITLAGTSQWLGCRIHLTILNGRT